MAATCNEPIRKKLRGRSELSVMYKIYQIIYTVYSWSIFVFFWIFSTFTAVILSMDTKQKEKIFNTIERYFSRVAFKVLGMKVEIQGIENIPKDEPVIFISNHQSMMDIKLALAYIPVNFSFISKAIVFNIPILGAYMNASGHIPIQRTEDRQAYATLLRAIKDLSFKQKSLVVFPEGTRSEDGRLGEFKRGISLIILKSGRRVVPMAITGSNQFMPKRGWLSNPDKKFIKISFGNPLSFDYARSDREYTIHVTHTLRKAVSELMQSQSLPITR